MIYMSAAIFHFYLVWSSGGCRRYCYFAQHVAAHKCHVVEAIWSIVKGHVDARTQRHSRHVPQILNSWKNGRTYGMPVKAIE